MDICDDILEENDRYAFLLGSALRNKDQDKFLEIYDQIIPKDLDEKEVNRTLPTCLKTFCNMAKRVPGCRYVECLKCSPHKYIASDLAYISLSILF